MDPAGLVIDLRVLTGPSLKRALDGVARLRIAVFREWPYLYDGDADYERRYLGVFAQSKDAIVVGAYNNGELVGASTASPLRDHADEFGAAFSDRSEALDNVFYCAESLLLPQFRGQGVGHRFFDLREDHARDKGYRHVCFCAVNRPADHPLRPSDHRSLDGFWAARGYRKLDGVRAQFAWKDIGQLTETSKYLQFWMRSL